MTSVSLISCLGFTAGMARRRLGAPNPHHQDQWISLPSGYVKIAIENEIYS